MLATECPRCGKPASIHLVAPDMLRCRACGYAGPPSPEAAGHLRAAASFLWGLDVRKRQLSAEQQRAITGARRSAWRYVVAVTVLGAPFALWTVVGVGTAVSSRSGFDIGLAAVGVAPLLFYAVWTGLTARWVRARARRIEEACAARPDPAGGPAACHVCGGPVPAPSGAPFVRCAFCGADNFCDPEVVRRMGAAHAGALRSFEDEIAARARAAERTVTGAGCLLVPMALGAPVGAFLLLIVVAVPLMYGTVPLDPRVEYAAVDTPAGRCLGLLHRERGGVVLEFGHVRPEGLPVERYLPSDAGLERLGAKALVGRRVRTVDYAGKVLEVYRTRLDPTYDVMRIEGAKGTHEGVYVRGACFDDVPAPPAPSVAPSPPKPAPKR